MRVAFLARTLNGCGVDAHIVTLAKGMIRSGCEVAVVSDGGTGEHLNRAEMIRRSGVHHETICMPGPNLNLRVIDSAVRSGLQVNSFLKRFRPDITHVHYRVTSIYAELAYRLRRVPYVTTLHLTSVPARGVYRLASFWGQRTICISSATRSYLIDAFRVPERQIRVIHNGGDESYFRPPSREERTAARNSLGVDPSAAVVSLVGHLAWVKGHDVLLYALAEMKSAGVRAVALFAGQSLSGDARWKSDMTSLAEMLEISDQIRFLGYADTRQILWASDVSVLPSREEGFPMAMVESMLCAVVPVRTPAGGASEQIDDGRTGFIVPFDDSSALAHKLALLLTDPDLRGRMGSSALQKVRREFSSASMVEKTISVYQEVIAENMKARRFLLPLRSVEPN